MSIMDTFGWVEFDWVGLVWVEAIDTTYVSAGGR